MNDLKHIYIQLYFENSIRIRLLSVLDIEKVFNSFIEFNWNTLMDNSYTLNRTFYSFYRKILFFSNIFSKNRTGCIFKLSTIWSLFINLDQMRGAILWTNSPPSFGSVESCLFKWTWCFSLKITNTTNLLFNTCTIDS